MTSAIGRAQEGARQHAIRRQEQQKELFQKWGIRAAISVGTFVALLLISWSCTHRQKEVLVQQSQPLQYHSMTGVPEQLFNAAAQTAGATPTTGELYVRNGECSTMNIPEGKWLDYTFPTGYVRAEIQTTYGGPWLPQQNNGNTVAVRWCGEGKVTWTIRS